MTLAQLIEELVFSTQEEASEKIKKYNAEHGSDYEVVVHPNGDRELSWSSSSAPGGRGFMTMSARSA